MKKPGLIIVVIVTIITTSCTMSSSDNTPMPGVNSLNICEADLVSLIEKAKDGDSGASLRIYRFYDFVKLDRIKAIFWLKKSAEDGNPQAQFILGKIYRDDPAICDLNAGLYWLKKSAKNGYAEAQDELKRLRD